MARLFFIIFYALFSNIPVFADDVKIYVDAKKGSDVNSGTQINPLKSIKEAFHRVGQVKDVGDIKIYLRNGEYQLDSPLVIDAELLDNRRLSVLAYKNEKPVLSGGYKITDWNIYDKINNIYFAKLPEGINGRQMFVDGIRTRRAYETDATKRWIVSDSIGHITSDMSLLKLSSPQYVECVYREIWTSPRCVVSEISQLGDTLVRVKMKQPGWKNCRNKGITSVRTPWYWENAFEFLDEEGEWYLDVDGVKGMGKNVIFYKPYSWNDMKKSSFVFPVLESLVEIRGTVDKPVCNIVFDGIGFTYTTWLRPGTDRGNPDAQNNVMRQNATKDGESAAEKAALIMKYVSNAVIKNCNFHGLGANGINMLAGCSGNTISGSVFYDLSATAIQIGDYKQWDSRDSEDSYDPIDKRNLITNNIIENNHIERCGIEYRSATGIATVFACSTEFRNNTLKDLPYSGFHIGWGWTTKPYTMTGNNSIYRNRIQNVMMELADGGSIYTLGGSRKESPSVISENYMYRTMWGQGIYLDNGSAYYTVSNNVYEDIDDYNVKINSGSHDCTAYGIYSNKVKNLVADKCNNCKVDSTYIFSEDNKKIVERIKRNAGAKNGFTSIWEMLDDCHIYEFEYADLYGGSYSTSGIGTGIFNYSGMGFVSGFNRNATNGIEIRAKISKSGTYRISMRYSMGKGWKDKIGMKINSSDITLDLNEVDKGKWDVYTFSARLNKGINKINVYSEGRSDDYLLFDVLYIDKLN